MSREAYVPPPTSSNNTAGSSDAAGTANAAALAPGGVFNYVDTSKPVQYLCGDCNAKVTLKRGDPIRCKECGHRVLYKERTSRMVQFEAR